MKALIIYGFKIVFDELCACKFKTYMTPISLYSPRNHCVNVWEKASIFPFAGDRKFHERKIGGERTRNETQERLNDCLFLFCERYALTVALNITAYALFKLEMFTTLF